MQLNLQKTKILIINFSKKYQFSTKLKLRNEEIHSVDQAKLLGSIITPDLKWKKNTEEIVKKSYQRMVILHKLSEYNPPKNDMKIIYVSYIRSILEQSCQVWHTSLTSDQSKALERVQKCAVRIILKNNYATYEDGLEELNLDILYERRERLCLKFAKACTQDERFRN